LSCIAKILRILLTIYQSYELGSIVRLGKFMKTQIIDFETISTEQKTITNIVIDALVKHDRPELERVILDKCYAREIKSSNKPKKIVFLRFTRLENMGYIWLLVYNTGVVYALPKIVDWIESRDFEFAPDDLIYKQMLKRYFTHIDRRKRNWIYKVLPKVEDSQI
jgi:hypothetical protein